MFSKPPPFSAAMHIEQALDALRMADEALAEASAALVEVELEHQGPIGSYEVNGFQAASRLFLTIFAPAVEAVGGRDVHPGTWEVIREHVQAQECSPGNPLGLERAAVALEFAVAGFEEAVDALDKSDSGDEWYSPCVAAHDMLEMVQVAIDSGRVRGRGPEYFDRGFFGQN
jgi:hypothetical protein